MNQAVQLPRIVVSQTIDALREKGKGGAEGIVLWVGRLQPTVTVERIVIPDQVSSHDFFRIPADSMQAILRMLSESQCALVAQVHSHPKEAFHSLADDTWAIVRHLGALSLVVPYFAEHTGLESFIRDVEAYQLNQRNKWVRLDPDERLSVFHLS